MLGRFNTGAWSVSHTYAGEGQKVSTLERGGWGREMFYLSWRGGGGGGVAKGFGPAVFPFCSTPPHN